MNNLMIVKIMTLLQAMALGIVYIEHDSLKKLIEKNQKKALVARVFMLAIPTLTVISLLIRPLES